MLRLRVAAALYWFRESLFLLPAIVVHAGVALAEVCAAVDRAAGPGRVVPLTLDINSNAATWLLSTVAGATITTAGVVVLTVGTVVLIIAHLDHLARGLQVGEFARGIAQEGEELIAAMLSRPATRSPRPGRYRRSDGEGFEVATARDGWVAQAAADRMLAAVPRVRACAWRPVAAPTSTRRSRWSPSGPLRATPTRFGTTRRRR